MRSILITGGTGYFGRGFVRQVLAETHVERICIFSRGEYAQALMREEFGDDGRLRWFIGDVRDVHRLRRALDGIDVVVHAAALKRIEVGHYNPDEMVKTNVLGAMNLIEAAMDCGVEKVVALSSDKAFQPVSPYGQSKAIAESLFLNANNMRDRFGPKFSVTRYGNVAGSTGSVIPRWRQVLKDGGRISITDPACTRFYMTLEEAVQLVSSTITTMKGGEIAVPTLPAYSLGDLAAAMGATDVELTGLPEWEKKHESMAKGNSSDLARRMTVDELTEALTHV